MTSLLLIALLMLLLAITAGTIVLLIGVAVVIVVIAGRRKERDARPTPALVDEDSAAEPAPLTRLVKGDEGLTPIPVVPAQAPPQRAAAPTLAPVLASEEHDFPDLQAFFERLEASDDASTELLSTEDKRRLYGFSVGD